MDLAVIVLTYNEELHIERCLSSLHKVAAKVFVVDSFSTDRTVEIAKKNGAEVYQRAWKNYADQFQWGLDNCPITTDWVMRLDADEYLDPQMKESIIDILSGADRNVSGYCCYLRNVFLGKKIRFGGYDPLRLLRVWRHGCGRMESRWMDEHIVLESGVIADMKGEIVHNNLNDNYWWTSKHNAYANREMVDVLANKYELFERDDGLEKTKGSSAKVKRFIKESVYNKLPVFLRPALYFFYRYVIRFGFLDGKEGYAYHFFQAYWYRSLVDLRVVEMESIIQKNKLSSKEDIISAIEKFTEFDLR